MPKGKRSRQPPAAEKPSMSESLGDYTTTAKAAEMLGVNRFWIVRLLAQGRLKGIKPGHDWLVFVPSIREYLESKSKRGRPSSGTPKIPSEE